MYFPNTTYRIQFHKGFTFEDLDKAIPYLHELGIQTIYASPIFVAVSDSTHGYDGLDSNAINPEIGTLEEFKTIAHKLKQLGIGWLQDFVPNHMAYTTLNPKIANLFEHGKRSAYYSYFDFQSDERIMAPFLGSSFDEVIGKNELQMVCAENQLWFRYYDEVFPLNYRAYSVIAESNPSIFPDAGKHIAALNAIEDNEKYESNWLSFKEQFANAIDEDQLSAVLKSINEDNRLLQELHELQYYRLCHWQETNSHINYRRFFTINGLIGVNIQNKHVFDDYHKLLFQLVDNGLIQGIRIDHVDGLYNPGQYLNQLRERVGKDVYIVVEKILEADENLPQWPIQGTTGYDYLAQVNNLLIANKGHQHIAQWFHKLEKLHDVEENTLAATKTLVLENYMKGEWTHLNNLFLSLLPKSVHKQFDITAMAALIKSMLIVSPVYRYYPDDDALMLYTKSFESLIHKAFYKANLDNSNLMLAMEAIIGKGQNSLSQEALHFWRKFMQLSGPLMAKGMEDTLMYREHQSLANNEVGDNPHAGGIGVEDFHRKMLHRQNTCPLTMNATATHDTKRGEDARARLQLLSHDAKNWLLLVKKILDKVTCEHISIQDQYAVLQAVYASLDVEQNEQNYAERLKQYLQKAARESKQHSSWEQPDEMYEQALFDYAKEVSKIAALSAYVKQRRAEMLTHTLVQLILKCTCPGVADIYQGTEFEDLSFVDPDNRRCVDYDIRLNLLQAVKLDPHSFQSLSDMEIDRAKLYTLHHLLQIRKESPQLFEHGVYQPIKTNSDNTIAFIRRYQNDWLLVVLPIDGQYHSGLIKLQLPETFPTEIKDTLSGEHINLTHAAISMGVYTAKSSINQRNAGVLLPLFSLPSPFGIGDLGKEAYLFAKSLSRAGQSFWQILPLSPVSKDQSFSPYASDSAFAASSLYIDMRTLQEDGYLTKEEIAAAMQKKGDEVDYIFAQKSKSKLLQRAYERFVAGTNQSGFQEYCLRNKSWLDSFSLYTVLKNTHDGKPWHDWPAAYSQRDGGALNSFAEQHKKEIAFEQWKQYVFDTQWSRLRNYCKALAIRLIGDVPFYMAADSADVWAHQSFFAIQADGKMTGVAGVPPDYFSETGQLWGMPVYNWKALQKEKYSWWIQRLQRNVQLFDLVRLDHFRAFYDYWEVKGNAETAINGVWKTGPQATLFNIIKKEFPAMPFIAEDLGEIHDGVFLFKDKYNLPGMRILQFGFEQYKSSLRDLPHNFNFNDIAYTGTHDNDTIVGWYKTLNKKAKKEISAYWNQDINSKNIASAMLQMLYQSIANTVIAPVQDVLGLDKKARVNTPSTSESNWKWIFIEGRLIAEQEKWLLELTKRFNRL